MSFILPSSAAPSQPGNVSPRATARSDEPGENAPGSFGEALSRSLQPAENTGKSTDKAATPATARRRASEQKADPEDLLNAMALSFTALESKIAKATPTTGGGGTAADKAVPGAAAAPLTDLIASSATSTGTPLAAMAVSTDADAQTALAAASPKDAGQATLQAQLTPATWPASDSSAIALDPGKIAAQANAPTTNLGNEPSKRDDRATQKPDPLTDASADLTPAATPGRAKAATTATAPAVETKDIANTASQAPDAGAAPLSASAALTSAPVNAAAQGPVGVAASSAPPPVTTASLSPEVGSSEWGKALGQQVVQMGHAGHQVAELQLNPPGLGPLKVTLSMSDQQIQVLFVSAHSSVRAAVEAALPQLRTSLADSGISLGNTSVSADSQQQAAFSQAQGGQAEQRSYRGTALLDTPALTARPVTEPLRRSNGISVDTYA
jgi:flagellar hook-length control protein FliK